MDFKYTCWAAIRANTYAAFRYHFGSLCLGALLLLIFGPLCLALVYLREILQRVFKPCAGICCCCTFFYEKLLSWITSNSYTLIAYQGKYKDRKEEKNKEGGFNNTNFRKGGLIASKLVDIDENFEVYGVTASLGGLFITLGNVFICFAIILLFYVILTQTEPYSTILTSPVFPVIVIGVFAFLSSSCFMSLYATVVESNLICLFIDEYLEWEEGKTDIEGKKCPQKMKQFIEVHSPGHTKKKGEPKKAIGVAGDNKQQQNNDDGKQGAGRPGKSGKSNEGGQGIGRAGLNNNPTNNSLSSD